MLLLFNEDETVTRRPPRGPASPDRGAECSYLPEHQLACAVRRLTRTRPSPSQSPRRRYVLPSLHKSDRPPQSSVGPKRARHLPHLPDPSQVTRFFLSPGAAPLAHVAQPSKRVRLICFSTPVMISSSVSETLILRSRPRGGPKTHGAPPTKEESNMSPKTSWKSEAWLNQTLEPPPPKLPRRLRPCRRTGRLSTESTS